ncbi:MAG TPA: hypothetical protein PLX03_02630, partial [Candidatus Hydrogenedentes bacterium]|nr:hypothetical protein [Candidatus Hydrogenedentota bacterium]
MPEPIPPSTTGEMEAPAPPILPRRRGCFGLFMAIILTGGVLWGAALGAFVWMVEHTTNRVADAFADFRPKVGSRV